MKKYLVFFITVILLIASGTSVKADSPAPYNDYLVYSDDGQHVFVMLVIPNEFGEFSLDHEIRDQYPESGLYRIDNPQEPIYKIHWYAYYIEISPDGQYLIRWGDWPTIGNYSDLALAFYDRGVLIKSYSVFDLVSWPPSLPKTASHYTWLAESEFNVEKLELYVLTQSDQEYLFDVSTGNVIREGVKVRFIKVFFFVGFSLIILLLVRQVVIKKIGAK